MKTFYLYCFAQYICPNITQESSLCFEGFQEILDLNNKDTHTNDEVDEIQYKVCVTKQT